MSIGSNLCFARTALVLRGVQLTSLIAINDDGDSPTGDSFGLQSIGLLRENLNSLELVEITLRVWAKMSWAEIAARRGYKDDPHSDGVPSRQAVHRKYGAAVDDLLRVAAEESRSHLLMHLGIPWFEVIEDGVISAEDDDYLQILADEAFAFSDPDLVLKRTSGQLQLWEDRHSAPDKWWWQKSPNLLE